ncbi:AraC family transcriptional regulator [Rhodococcus qingshengii]|uniref:AraC family transcriptional regulator n=1 Tax=Rhodococcus qingshengii TaxID=334542 RepID=UPI001BE4F996|nr:AraC family transcriptional regulator [Rhodococcus qingshengii]MBT2273346.1 AraC family transcriptional regulator [Rhodococcus qingshengii]
MNGWQSASTDLSNGVWMAPDAYPGVRALRTSELPAAESALSAAYAPGRLTLGRKADDFELRLIRAGFSSLEISAMSLGTDVTLLAPPVRDRYVVILPFTGGVTVGTRTESLVLGDDIGLVTGLGQPYYFERWSPDCRLVCLRLEKSRLDGALARLARRPATEELQFSCRLDMTNHRIAPFVRAVQLVVSELNDYRSHMSPLLSDSIAELVTNALLLHHPHSHSDLFETPVGADLPSAIYDARVFMSGHLGDEITVADIARAAQVSVRTLEELFQRAIGVAPMAEFRRLRLARAHEALTTAAPDSTTVAKIAKRWGFRHQGRFAIEYRRAYGLSPSEQLRRPQA